MLKNTIVCVLCLALALPAAAQGETAVQDLVASLWSSLETLFDGIVPADEAVPQEGDGLEEGPSIVPNG